MALPLEEQCNGSGAQMTLVSSADGSTELGEAEGDKSLNLLHPNSISEGVWERVLREVAGEIDVCSLREWFEGISTSDLEATC